MMRTTSPSKQRVFKTVLNLYDGYGSYDDELYLEHVLRSEPELSAFAMSVIQLEAMLAAEHRPTPFDNGRTIELLPDFMDGKPGTTISNGL